MVMVGSMVTPAAPQATCLTVVATQFRTCKSSLPPDSMSFLQTWSVAKLANVSRSTNFHIIKSAAKEAKAAGVAFARSSGQMERSINIEFKDDALFTSEPFGEKQLKVSVKLTCNGTRRTFDLVLENLRRSTPPVQGFRKSKGGKSIVSNSLPLYGSQCLGSYKSCRSGDLITLCCFEKISKDVLYQMLGPSTVNSFVVEELITSCLLEYVEKEGFKVKQDFKTLQSNKELAASFKAGEEFVFDAILSLEDEEGGTARVEEDQNQ